MSESTPIIRYRLLWLATALLCIALFLLPLGYELAPYVELNSPDGSVHPVNRVWLDAILKGGITVSEDVSENGGVFRGYLYRPGNGVLWLENSLHVPVTLSLNDDIVYEGSGNSRLELPENPAIIPFELNYADTVEQFDARGKLGFMLVDVFGRTYPMPDWNYAPDAETPFDTGADIARFLFMLCIPVVIALTLAALRLSRRDWLVLAGIFGLALLVQGITMQDKLLNNELLWTMETTWDNYVDFARGWLIDAFPIAGQETQQGNFIYLGVLQRIIGTDFGTLYWFNTLLSAIVPVLLTLAGWGFFNRRSGILAGIMAATFAPMLHYQQTLQPASPVLLLLAFLIAAGYLLYRDKSLLMAIVYGVLIGLMMVMRGSMILLLAWLPLLLLLQKSAWRRKILLTLLAGMAFSATLLPILITNWNAGFHILTPSRSEIQLLRANNITSMGLNTHMEVSEALARVREPRDFMAVLREDISRDPLRVLELTIRRVGLLWQSAEHSDSRMIDYLENSFHPAQTMRLLSLDNNLTVRTIFLLATVSLFAAWFAQHRRHEILLLWGLVIIYCGTMIPFYVLGRLRIGLAPPLILLAAVSLVYVWQGRKAQQIWRKTVLASVLAIALIAFGADWLVGNFPRPQYITENELPESYIPVDATYENKIRVSGYGYRESGFDRNGDGYVIFELYWQALQDMDEDYVLILRFLHPQTQDIMDGHNVTIGTETVPSLPTSHWRAGDMIFERYLVRFPDDKRLPAYELFAGVYSNITEDQLKITAQNSPLWSDDNVRLMALPANPIDTTQADTKTAQAAWLNALMLTSYECSFEENTVSLTLDWYMQAQLYENPHLFVHVYQDEEFITGLDGKVMNDFPVDAWLPGTTQTISRTVPEMEAVSRVDIGFYNPLTQQRWIITGATDGLAVANDVLSLPCE